MFDWLSWDFVVRFLNITVIDLVLSGDNAIVIGMAAASLPREKRKMAIVLGGATAIGLRILLTTIATLLMKIPLLSVVGGLVLIWVAYKLLKIDTTEHEDPNVKQAKNFRQAIILILTADFMMSIDNVIAVAGAAHGSFFLLIAGLIISMPLLMTTGGAISMLIDKVKWLIFVGAAAICFTGIRMALEDKFIEERTHLHGGVVIAISVVAGLLIPTVLAWMSRRREKKRQAATIPSV